MLIHADPESKAARVFRGGAMTPGATTGVQLSRRLTSGDTADACYFRSGPPSGARKALLKVTDRCDLRCAHCFVSATQHGADMSVSSVEAAIPRLQQARVTNVTVTGGEPLVHPDLQSILELLVDAGFEVTVCTNGVALTDELIERALAMGHIRFNVSVDGITADSHGRFRGRRDSFERTLDSVHRLGDAALLKGVLSTPNSLARAHEFEAVYELADRAGAEYLLMNPLSSFGRGIRSRGRLKADEQAMVDVQHGVENIARTRGAEAVFIRFPNEDRPLSGCIAGDVFYVFVNGDVAVCPYLVFATENAGSKHTREEFIVGNLFADVDIASKLDSYRFHERYQVGSNPSCATCSANGSCGKGCPAAVIASGGSIGDVDAEVCPTPARVRCS